MKKFKMKCGHIAYRVSVKEIMTTGGMGICDKCNAFNGTDYDGYLIPVLNRWYCKPCFIKFAKSAKFHEEDLWFEEKLIKEYEEQLGEFLE